MSEAIVQQDQDTPGAYTVSGLAKRLGVSEKWVWSHVYDGRLAGVIRCGRAIRIDRATIERRILGGKVLLDKAA